MLTIRIVLLFLLLPSSSAVTGLELIGDVDEKTRDELLEIFRDGAQTFAGGYLFDEFEPGLDKYITSIQNDNGKYIVTTKERPCHETRITVRKICYSPDRCFWDVNSAYLCLRN